jgi:AraC-like DNA-binding protein
MSCVLVGGEIPAREHLYMLVVYLFGRIIFLLQTVVYLIWNFKLIKVNHHRLQDYYSNIEMRELNWVQFFNFCLAITSVASGVLASLGREFFLNNELLLVFPSIIFSLMLFFIGLLGSGQKTVYTEVVSEDLAPDVFSPTKHLKTRMEKLFIDQKIYKDPNLKIWDLSSMLGTNRTYVSKAINQEYGCNFCSHVNHYRLLEAKKLIRENPDLSNNQVAGLSGFGSVNSMNRAFIAAEDLSLSRFRERSAMS